MSAVTSDHVLCDTQRAPLTATQTLVGGQLLPQVPLGRTAFYESRRSSEAASVRRFRLDRESAGRVLPRPCCEPGRSRARAAPCGPSCRGRPRRPGSGRPCTRSRGGCPRTTLKPSRTFCRPRHSSHRLCVRACCRLGGVVPELRAMGPLVEAARSRTRHERPGPPLLPHSLQRRVPERRPSLGAPAPSKPRFGRTPGAAPAAAAATS